MQIEKQKIDIMICSKDRPTELGLLLQSLRTQTYQNFDVYIYDDRSGTPSQHFYFITKLVNQMMLENHRVHLWRNEIKYGVTRLRKIMVDRVMKVGRGTSILRVDDDTILEPDYIERLVKVLDKGYDIASGTVPMFGMPTFKRETKFVKPFIADIVLNKDGTIKSFGDDCGYNYIEKEIIPSPHFRSAALIKKEVHKKVNYETDLGFCSFREEEFFSFRCLCEGFKIAVDTGAIAWHLMTPSGGERTEEYVKGLEFNNELLSKFSKKLYEKHGDFVEKYKKSVKS